MGAMVAGCGDGEAGEDGDDGDAVVVAVRGKEMKTKGGTGRGTAGS